MRVRATAWGYYGNAGRNPGEVFNLKPFKTRRLVTKNPKTGEVRVTKSDKDILIGAEEQFSETWMEKVEASTPIQKIKKTKGRSDAFPPEQSPQARDVNHPREETDTDSNDDFEDDSDARNNEDVI